MIILVLVKHTFAESSKTKALETKHIYTLITTFFSSKSKWLQNKCVCFPVISIWRKFEEPLSQRDFQIKFGSNKEIMETLILLK